MIKFISSISNLSHSPYNQITQKEALNSSYSLINKCKAPVAQLDRALGYGPGGSGFDS